jgi:hypothetical protein
MELGLKEQITNDTIMQRCIKHIRKHIILLLTLYFIKETLGDFSNNQGLDLLISWDEMDLSVHKLDYSVFNTGTLWIVHIHDLSLSWVVLIYFKED